MILVSLRFNWYFVCRLNCERLKCGQKKQRQTKCVIFWSLSSFINWSLYCNMNWMWFYWMSLKLVQVLIHIKLCLDMRLVRERCTRWLNLKWVWQSCACSGKLKRATVFDIIIASIYDKQLHINSKSAAHTTRSQAQHSTFEKKSYSNLLIP